MAQLVLFDNKGNPGPDEFVVIDVDDLNDNDLRAEYEARIVSRTPVFLPYEDSWPSGRGLHE